MRLVFLYVADGAAPVGSRVLWDSNKRCHNYFATRFQEEGYFHLLQCMVEAGIVDDVLVVVESNRGPGRMDYGPRITGLVMPEINDLKAWLRWDDVIWCRGGFRSWHDFLSEQAAAGRWLLIYAANTGRGKWPFWDVVFDDLAGRNFVDGADRVHLDFRKPTRPDVFHPMGIPRVYDLCMGASRIHDRKGQWRAVEVAAAYKGLYGQNLKCVLPGPWAKGVKTNQIGDRINACGLDVTVTDSLDRPDLARVLNQSRLFVHLGSHGQGDRGVMEALRCGCLLIIGFPQYHAPWICQNRDVTWVPDDPEDYDAIAHKIRKILEDHNALTGRQAFIYHERCCGMKQVILPRIARLFNLLRLHPTADKELLRKEYALK
jgi:hypothetical protein